MFRSCSVAVLLLLPLSTAMPQTGASELQRKANDAWTAQHWSTAAESYRMLVRENPTLPQPHFRLGVSLIGLRRHAEARAHLVVAESLGTPAPQVAFRLALIHAASGAMDEAFDELRRATDGGLAASPVPVETDPDVARLRSDERFAQFLTAMDRNARPCLHDARHDQFDFWLGTWDVRPNGQPTAPPGTNVITKIHNGCVVLESWSAPPSTGQSFNLFDRTRGKWFQTWVDNFGGMHEYAGTLVDGNMVFEGEMPTPGRPTTRTRTRLTFFRLPDGSVRQFSEITPDSGKTWRVNYDLIYTKRQ